MSDIIIGAIIAIITAIITLSFTEYLKFYFVSKKDEQNLIYESFKKMKNILVDTKFTLRDVYTSCIKGDDKAIPKFSPNEWKKLSKTLIELNAIAFNLSTHPKTENLSKSINKLYECANSYLLLLNEVTNNFEIQISEIDDKEIFENILGKYEKLIKTIEELLKTSISKIK
jgi:hypothetical protein